jgi:hypothetical protein
MCEPRRSCWCGCTRRVDQTPVPAGRRRTGDDPEGHVLLSGWTLAGVVPGALPEDTQPVPKPRRHLGPVVGVDLGVKHLATLSHPVLGVTDEHGHVANPKVLDQQLRRLQKLDRKIARCQAGSNNRQVLHGVRNFTARSPRPANSICTSWRTRWPAGSTWSASKT